MSSPRAFDSLAKFELAAEYVGLAPQMSQSNKGLAVIKKSRRKLLQRDIPSNWRTTSRS